MQKLIGLLGYVNKSEYVLNLAKVMQISGKRILVVDSTLEENYKYTIPSIDRTGEKNVTNFESVDFAIGFKDIEEIKEYLCKTASDVGEYDFILVDIDNPKSYSNFCKEKFSKYYFFIEHTISSITRNEDLVSAVHDLTEGTERPEFIKVEFQSYMTRASKKLFEGRLQEYNIVWKDAEYILTYSDQDKIASFESELSGFIDFSRHTKQYMELLVDMSCDIIEDISSSEIKKNIKNYSRRRF